MKTKTEIQKRIVFLQKKLNWIYKRDKKIPADQSEVESYVQLSIRIDELVWVLLESKDSTQIKCRIKGCYKAAHNKMLFCENHLTVKSRKESEEDENEVTTPASSQH